MLERPDGPVTDSVHNPEFLRRQSRWIRDILDPRVARNGPQALTCDEVLELDEFLRRLLTNVPFEVLKYSRIHRAVGEIAGKATRWPGRLIDRCDALITYWEDKHGSLASWGIVLYQPGGRLHGIAKVDDLSMDMLLVTWIKSKSSAIKVNPMRARKTGDLGFKPGEWWINPMFAYRDGVLDSGNPKGGICHDADMAYAVLMTGEDEIWGPDFNSFTYRAPSEDKGKYRLTAGTEISRQPVRILRSHRLRSFWAPKAGVRYDGLHVVISWTISSDNPTGNPIYDITFKRLPTTVIDDRVLCRPYADEVEDYREYKRLRQEARKNLTPAIPEPRIGGVQQQSSTSCS